MNNTCMSATDLASENTARWRRGGMLWVHQALFAISVGLASVSAVSEEPLQWLFAWEPVPQSVGKAKFERALDLRADAGVMHAAHIAVGTPTRILWFQGSKEAVPDVEIWAADYHPDTGDFAAEYSLFDRRHMTSAMRPAQPVLVLGNTIQKHAGIQDRMISTVVSAGGWAAAAIADVQTQADLPVVARKLPLSPLLNRSTLVRGGSVRFADNTIAIPAYHELVGAFGLLVRLGADARVKGTARIGVGRQAIQPEIVVTGPATAVAFLRPLDGSGKLYRSETVDGGQHWALPRHVSGVASPDSPVAALALSDGRILMAANNIADNDTRLALLVSADHGLNWKEISVVADFSGQKRASVRYPDIERLPDGDIMLTYSTGSKRGITAVVFNEAWVRAHE